MLFFTGRYYLCRQYSSYTQWSSGDASSTCLSWIWVCKTSWYVMLSMLHSMFGCNFMQRKFKYFIGYISSDRSFYTLNISREGLLVTLDLNGVKFEVMGCRWLNLTTWAKTRVVVEYSQWQFVYFFLSSKCIPCQPFRTGICIICNQTRNHFWLWTGNFHPWWVWLNKFTNKPDTMTHKRVSFGGEPEKWYQEY